MSMAVEPGLWDFKLLRQLVVCPSCETKNRLAYNRPRPACGKCKGSLEEAKPVAPKLYRAPRFQPTTPEGTQFLREVREGHLCFSNRIFEEAIRSYRQAIQIAFEGRIPEHAELEAVLGEVKYYKGICHYLLGEFEQAAIAFKSSLEPLRFLPEAYLWLMASLERSGRLTSEIAFLRTVFGPETPPSVRKALAPRYQYAGDPTAEINVRLFREAVLREDPELLQAVLEEAPATPEGSAR